MTTLELINLHYDEIDNMHGPTMEQLRLFYDELEALATLHTVEMMGTDDLRRYFRDYNRYEVEERERRATQVYVATFTQYNNVLEAVREDMTDRTPVVNQQMHNLPLDTPERVREILDMQVWDNQVSPRLREILDAATRGINNLHVLADVALAQRNGIVQECDAQEQLINDDNGMEYTTPSDAPALLEVTEVQLPPLYVTPEQIERLMQQPRDRNDSVSTATTLSVITEEEVFHLMAAPRDAPYEDEEQERGQGQSNDLDVDIIQLEGLPVVRITPRLNFMTIADEYNRAMASWEALYEDINWDDPRYELIIDHANERRRQINEEYSHNLRLFHEQQEEQQRDQRAEGILLTPSSRESEVSEDSDIEVLYDHDTLADPPIASIPEARTFAEEADDERRRVCAICGDEVYTFHRGMFLCQRCFMEDREPDEYMIRAESAMVTTTERPEQESYCGLEHRYGVYGLQTYLRLTYFYNLGTGIGVPSNLYELVDLVGLIMSIRYQTMRSRENEYAPITELRPVSVLKWENPFLTDPTPILLHDIIDRLRRVYNGELGRHYLQELYCRLESELRRQEISVLENRCICTERDRLMLNFCHRCFGLFQTYGYEIDRIICTGDYRDIYLVILERSMVQYGLPTFEEHDLEISRNNLDPATSLPLPPADYKDWILAEDDQECTVCRDTKVCHKCTNNHFVCEECIENWETINHGTCPICRTPMRLNR